MPRAPGIEWRAAEDAPLVPSRDIAEALRGGGGAPPPGWATRDGGFLARDRSLRVGFRDWSYVHRERWEDARAANCIAGGYDPRTGLWCFESLEAFGEVMGEALAHLGHPRCAPWLSAINKRAV